VKWSERQDFHLRPPGPKVLAHGHEPLIKTELRSEKNGGSEGTCTLMAVRKDPSRRSRSRGTPLIELRIQKWWPLCELLHSSL